MVDIWLKDDMDLLVTESGDILVAGNIAQAVKVRLLWIEKEWRLGPEIGFPWFTEVFIKRPDLGLIQQSIRDTIMDVDGIADCTVTLLSYDIADRKISFRYSATTEEGAIIVEEVELDG